MSEPVRTYESANSPETTEKPNTSKIIRVGSRKSEVNAKSYF